MACKFLGAIIKGIVILYLHDIILITLWNRMSVGKPVRDENKNAVNILMKKAVDTKFVSLTRNISMDVSQVIDDFLLKKRNICHFFFAKKEKR